MSDTQPDPVPAEGAAPADPAVESPAAEGTAPAEQPAADVPASGAETPAPETPEQPPAAPVPGPWLVFETDADARNAILTISRAMGLGRHTTSLYTLPEPLPDGRVAVLKPGDDAYLADVTGYTEAAEIVTADGTGADLYVPGVVSLAQARAVMLMTPSRAPGAAPGRTLYDDVDEAIRAGQHGTVQQKIAFQAWEFSNQVTRDGALVEALSAQMGLAPADLDRLFRAAAQIQF